MISHNTHPSHARLRCSLPGTNTLSSLTTHYISLLSSPSYASLTIPPPHTSSPIHPEHKVYATHPLQPTPPQPAVKHGPNTAPATYFSIRPQPRTRRDALRFHATARPRPNTTTRKVKWNSPKRSKSSLYRPRPWKR